jgi:hypothetical protein
MSNFVVVGQLNIQLKGQHEIVSNPLILALSRLFILQINVARKEGYESPLPPGLDLVNSRFFLVG